MNLKHLSLLWVCAFLLIESVQGASPWAWQSGGDKFGDQELKFDLFASIASRDRDDFESEDQLGFGVGVSRFFSPYLGFMAETYIEEIDWPTHLDASVIGRYPVRDWGLAPYGFGGLGRQFREIGQWTLHLGGGLDFRFTRENGVFADVRRVFADKTADFTLWRLGVRFGF